MSLTELLVASMLIGIVMIGVASFTSAIKQFQSTNERSSILEIRTSAAVNHIRRNAMVAVGYRNDLGMRCSGGSPAYFSFRQDRLATPGDFADDTWVIYTDGSTAGRMYVCTQNAASGPVPLTGGGQPCDPSGKPILLQNIQAIQFVCASDDATSALDLYFEINLTTRYDRLTAYNPVTNPQYSIDTRISLASHGW